MELVLYMGKLLFFEIKITIGFKTYKGDRKDQI